MKMSPKDFIQARERISPYLQPTPLFHLYVDRLDSCT